MPDDSKIDCPHCGGRVDPRSTCPKSIECPTCGAAPYAHCKRPSGHKAAMHHRRIARAESKDMLIGVRV